MSKRPMQARYAESAAQTIYDLRDCIRTSETELYARLDATAQWLSSLGARFEDDGTLRPGAHPEAPRAELGLPEGVRGKLEAAWEEGYWAAEQDQFKRISANPYRTEKVG